MSLVTNPKVLNEELQSLVESYISQKVVTQVVSPKKLKVSFISKHLGKRAYSKSRRYA